MRIAVVHSFYSSRQPSGENAVVREQVAALRNAGHDVLLIARSTDELETRPLHGVRAAATVASGRGSSPAGELETFVPDVVHLHNTFPNLGTHWLREWGSRTVVTLHNYRTVCAAGTLFRDGKPCTDCLETPVLPALRHACYRGSRVATLPVALASRPGGSLRTIGQAAREVVVLNEAAQLTLEATLGRTATVVPNFTAAVVAAPQQRSGRWAFVGRLSQEKGALELVDCWPASEPLTLFGDGPLRAEMEALAKRRALDVEFRGLTPHADLLASLAEFEGLVVPSMCAEGLPTAVIEALARSVPIVVSDLVSLAPEITRAGAGVVVDMPSTVTGMEGALTKLRALPDAPSAARRMHEERYSEPAWLAAMTPIYERVSRP